MIPIYHTYCGNCETKYHLIEEIKKESYRCKNCGVYMWDSYDDLCDCLDNSGFDGIICELCEEIDVIIKTE